MRISMGDNLAPRLRVNLGVNPVLIYFSRHSYAIGWFLARSSRVFQPFNNFKTDKSEFQHNLATRVDKAAIMEAYNDVMADNNNIEWSVSTSYNHNNNILLIITITTLFTSSQ